MPSFVNSNYDNGGPATAYVLGDFFNSKYRIVGITVGGIDNGGAVFMDGCVQATIENCTFEGLGPAASLGKSITFLNCMGGSNHEVDKIVETCSYSGGSAPQILVQSASVRNLALTNVNLDKLIGCGLRTTITRSNIGFFQVGAAGYGLSESLTVTDSTIQRVERCYRAFLRDKVTFENGSFKELNIDYDLHTLFAAVVPGRMYTFSYFAGTAETWTDQQKVFTFRVTDFRQDATYTYIDTDISRMPSPLPTVYNGKPYNAYNAYEMQTSVQTNSGPADATKFDEPKI